IIERGIEAYLQEDYLVAIHLLIPQIEEAVRLILEMNGGVKIKPKNDAYQLKTLDDILRDPIMVNSMGEDICFYFQQIFTNVRGLNLRNDVCHGILAHEKFNFMTADLVFHALLTLGLVKKVI
ncbi:MAG: DUF4209 domain-containing protein, partial [Prevotella sp.]|nr:DUF4209 domain-containing protein [Prevotella sp.]